jgi:GTPase
VNNADIAPPEAKSLLDVYPGSVLFAAETGDGMDGLLDALSDRLRALDDVVELLVPFDRGDVVAAVHREGEVLTESHEDEGTRLRVRVDEAGASRFREFAVS